MFFKLYYHFNAFSAQNRRLVSIEFQFHTNTHITLWLTVVSTFERHSCVARASEIPVESFRRRSTNKEKYLETSFTRVAISLMQHLRKGKSLVLKIYDTLSFDKSAVTTWPVMAISHTHFLASENRFLISIAFRPPLNANFESALPP